MGPGVSGEGAPERLNFSHMPRENASMLPVVLPALSRAPDIMLA